MSRSKADQEREKVIQERCQNLLSRLLKEEDNKYCVDCDSKGPRWASWNIGVFLCIRCAGIHRNLGVHISKVRSVNLDSWTPAQVSSMQCMGNSRGRAVYEASVPDDFKRPHGDSGLEHFIRAKYEKKKYIMKDWVATKPPDLPEGWQALIEQEKLGKAAKQLNVPISSGGSTSKSPETRKSGGEARKPETTSINNKTNSHQLVSSGVGKSSSVSSLSTAISSTVSSHSVDLLGLSSAGGGSQEDDDPFSNFVSAPPAAAATTVDGPSSAKGSVSSTLEQDFFNQVSTPSSNATSVTAAGGGGGGGAESSKMSNSSIMALFSSVPQNKGPTMIASPAAPQALGYPPPQQQQQSLYPSQQLHQAFPQQPQQQQHFHGLGQLQSHPQMGQMFNNNIVTGSPAPMVDPLAALTATKSSSLDPLAALSQKPHQPGSAIGGSGQNVLQMNNQFSGLNLQPNQSAAPQHNLNQLTPTSIQGLYNSGPAMSQPGLANNLFPGGQMTASNNLFSSPSIFSSPASGQAAQQAAGQAAANSLANSLWN